jgi:hypothetical protein
MTERGLPGADSLADAYEHCAALARAHARDQWLGALYASSGARGALCALASFDYEIRHALIRARNPTLAAIRLAWWREAIAGERPDEAAGNPVSLALLAAIDAHTLPKAWLEAMLDARLREIAPEDDFNLAAFRAFGHASEGARLRLAARIAAGGADLDSAGAHAPAGMALELARVLKELPFKAGSANADPCRHRSPLWREHGRFRHAARKPRRPCGLRRIAAISARRTRRGGAAAERFCFRHLAGFHSAWSLAARPRPARPQRGATLRSCGRGLAAASAMGDLAMGPKAVRAAGRFSLHTSG